LPLLKFQPSYNFITLYFTYKDFFFKLIWCGTAKKCTYHILRAWNFRGKILLRVTFSDRGWIIQITASCAIYFVVNRIADGPIRCPEIRLWLCDEDLPACLKIRPCINVFRWRCVRKEKIHFHLLLITALDEAKDKMLSGENPPQTGGKSLVKKSDFKTFPQSVQSIHILICYFSKKPF